MKIIIFVYQLVKYTIKHHIMNYQEQFYDACEDGDLTAITYLLNNYNIDGNVDDEYGFRLACKYGHLNVVQFLTQNYDINVHAENESGFRWACINGHLNVVEYLTQNYDIDVHAENEYGFRLACVNGHLNVVQYLLENNYNIDVHADNEYGFRIAYKYGYLNVVQYLLTKMKLTNEMIKILCRKKCEYFDEIKSQIKVHKHVVKLHNNKLQSCKILFTLYKTINIENTIYLGII